MKKPFQIFIFSLILILALYLRFYNLENIPAGLHADAASQGYNAFSLLDSGKDRYGQSFPILFRAFGYYQPPLYTYLTMIPVAILGNSQFSAHFISALSGLILIIITYLFVLKLFSENQKFILALIAVLTVTLAPWAIFFSRLAIEANLGLLLFAISLLLFIYSLNRIQILPVASFILGISTHAYYSERLISIIFLPIFIFIFNKNFLVRKKWIILALLLFTFTQIPHLMILKSGAFAQRFNQVSYFGADSKIQSHIVNVGKTTLNNYLIYYSPYNLFFDSDINLGRTMPGLSVFYGFLLIPFVAGIWYLLKKKSTQSSKIIGLLLVITPLPAVFTGDFFYPLRTLDFLWVLTLVIILGLFQIYLLLKSKTIKLILGVVFLTYSFFSLYISYFVLFKYEKAVYYGYAYIKLLDKLLIYNNKQIVIDSARDPGIGVRIAYLKKYPPKEIQNQLHIQMQTPYYSNEINTNEVYYIDNIVIKPINFGDACKSNIIMVGDRLAFSTKQIEDHNLRLEFEIPDLSGKTGLLGYSTHPKESCLKKIPTL